MNLCARGALDDLSEKTATVIALQVDQVIEPALTDFLNEPELTDV
jgi:hypothetical protein